MLQLQAEPHLEVEGVARFELAYKKRSLIHREIHCAHSRQLVLSAGSPPIDLAWLVG